MVENVTVDLMSIIRSNKVPLESIEDKADPSQDPTIKLYARRRSSSYIAVSQVGADGLGNLTKNALPQCQFNVLKAPLDRLEHQSVKSPLPTLGF